MGNSYSLSSLDEDVQLASQTHQPVLLPLASTATPPRVLAQATKLRFEKLPGSDDLTFFDFATGEKLYRLDDKASPEWTENLLVDGHDTPVVWLMRELGYNITHVLKAPSSADSTELQQQQQQQQFKIASARYHDKIQVELSLTDTASGEPLTVFVKEKLKLNTCCATLWLARGRGRAAEKHAEPIGLVAWTLDDGCNIQLAAGVDCAIAALFTIVFHEMINTHNKYSQWEGIHTCVVS